MEQEYIESLWDAFETNYIPSAHHDEPRTHRTARTVPRLYLSIQHRERVRSIGSGHAAVFPGHAAKRAYDGAHDRP